MTIVNRGGSPGRIPELDGIRGLAIGMVVVYHYFVLGLQAAPGTLWSHVQAAGRLGWSGVDLFFVLSGFLIGGILLEARESANYFQVFYVRRFLRIVPVYAVCLATAFFASSLGRLGITQDLAWMYRDRLPWTPHILFLQNFWMAALTRLGANGLSVTWSLAIEEQFYLTLPALIRVLDIRRLVWVSGIGIIAAPILRVTLHAWWPTHILSPLVLMPCRGDALLLGVVGAIVWRNARSREYIQTHRRVVAAALGVLACGAGVLTKVDGGPWSFLMISVGYTWLATLYVVFLLCGLLWRDGRMGRWLRWRWLGWLGSIAYGVYLFHDFIRYALFSVVWSRPPSGSGAVDVATTIAALIITLVVCWMSWTYFEKPLVQMGHRLAYDDGPSSRG